MPTDADSPWSAPSVVAGFASSAPNPVLMRFAESELRRRTAAGTRRHRALDLGCGAGRNAVALAGLGWEIVGLDNSLPMLRAAASRPGVAGCSRSGGRDGSDGSGGSDGSDGSEGGGGGLRLALAGMERIPLADRSCDMVIAHGIWNLARSSAEFRQALREAARVAAPGAALFVFTFSRHTFPPATPPVAGEPFVFTQFSGQPQCFLTAEQLMSELAAVGFVPDPGVPLTEYNRAPPGARGVAAPPTRPVILESAFRFAL